MWRKRETNIARGSTARVELIASNGDHVHYIPGALAKAMVAAGSAAIHNQNGKVRGIKLLESARTHLQRIGPPMTAAPRACGSRGAFAAITMRWSGGSSPAQLHFSVTPFSRH